MNAMRSLIALVMALVASLALAAPEPVITPADNLVVEGVPPIPARLVDEVNPYTQFRGAMILGWHPVRLEMLLSTRFGDTAQVHYVKFPGGARTQLTFFPDATSGGEFPRTGTGDFFVFDKSRRLVYRGQMDDSRPGNYKPNDGADLRAALDAVLVGLAPAGEQKPSVGCNIKWAS